MRWPGDPPDQQAPGEQHDAAPEQGLAQGTRPALARLAHLVGGEGEGHDDAGDLQKGQHGGRVALHRYARLGQHRERRREGDGGHRSVVGRQGAAVDLADRHYPARDHIGDEGRDDAEPEGDQ